MMANLVIKEIGLYEDIKLDERGLPVSGTPLSTPVVGKGKAPPILYLRIGGDPGSYWLTIDAKVPAPLRATFPGFHVQVPPDGDTHLTIHLPIPADPPSGEYVLTMFLANIRLAEIGFEIA